MDEVLQFRNLIGFAWYILYDSGRWLEHVLALIYFLHILWYILDHLNDIREYAVFLTVMITYYLHIILASDKINPLYIESFKIEILSHIEVEHFFIQNFTVH